MLRNKKKLSVLVVVIILVIILLCVFGKKLGIIKDNYSIVYLTTGEVYVGHLSTFPDLQLKDAYVFQAVKDTTDPTKSTFQLQPLKEAVWSPTTLHLVKKNIVFYGPLSPDSTIAKTITGQVK
jgi:hypothetical protein